MVGALRVYKTAVHCESPPPTRPQNGENRACTTTKRLANNLACRSVGKLIASEQRVPAELGRRAAGLASCGRRPAAEEALTLRVSIREIGQQYYLLRGNIEATTLVLVFVCLRSGNVRDCRILRTPPMLRKRPSRRCSRKCGCERGRAPTMPLQFECGDCDPCSAP
jgi:hypothetical protein